VIIAMILISSIKYGVYIVMACYYVIMLSFNKSETLKVCQESSDDTRMLEKGFPDMLSCNRSLKRALSRLSEILKLASDINSLERGLARLSDHSCAWPGKSRLSEVLLA